METLLTQLGLPTALVTGLIWMWSHDWNFQIPLMLWFLTGALIYYWDFYLKVPYFKDRLEELQGLQKLPSAPVSGWLKQVLDQFFTDQNKLRPWHELVAQRFAQLLGTQVWSYTAFDRLILFSLIYPLLWLLGIWLITGAGQLGSAQVLPDWGAGFSARHWKSTLLPMLLVALVAIWIRCLGWFDNVANERIPAARMGITIIGFVTPVVFFGPNGGSTALGFAAILAIVATFALALGLLAPGTGAFTLILPITAAFLIVTILHLAATFGFVVAIAGTLVIGSFGLGTVLGTVSFLMSRLRNSPPLIKSPWSVLVATGVFASLLISVAIMTPHFLPTALLDASEPSFAALTFGGFFPLVNGLFDWLSVALTRQILLWYSDKLRAAKILLILLDIVLALLLVVGLYALVLLILVQLQRWGWGIDAAAMVQQFKNDPFDPRVSWIAMMAITNLIPTLIHLGTWAWSVWMRPAAFSTPGMVQLLQVVRQQARSTSTGIQVQPVPPNSPLGVVDLKRMFVYLMFERWLILSGVIAIVIALWEPYLLALKALFDWLPII